MPKLWAWNMEVLQKGAGVCKPPAGPWQSPFWLFVAEDIKTASIKIKKILQTACQKACKFWANPISWLIYQLLAKYNTTPSRISHPVVIVVGWPELRRDIYHAILHLCRGIFKQSIEKQVCKDTFTGGTSIIDFIFFPQLIIN